MVNQQRTGRVIKVRDAVWETIENGALATGSSTGFFVEVLVAKFLKETPQAEFEDEVRGCTSLEAIEQLFVNDG